MDTLPDLYPNVEDLLTLLPEDLTPILLRFALRAGELQNGRFQISFVSELACGDAPHVRTKNRYSPLERRKLEMPLGEAWHFIEREAFIITDPGYNGQNGFKVLTSKGRAAAENFDAQRYREAAAFPKALLHPMIADKVSQALTRNDLGDAIFYAFRAVEIEVRDAAGLSANDVGEKLMRKAFDKDNGVLTSKSDPDGERIALQHLFAGAFGVFRNSHGHRAVITDLRDAQYQVLLASPLFC
jgi:uncharacterized protein (TIGR02391 family)